MALVGATLILAGVAAWGLIYTPKQAESDRQNERWMRALSVISFYNFGFGSKVPLEWSSEIHNLALLRDVNINQLKDALLRRIAEMPTQGLAPVIGAHENLIRALANRLAVDPIPFLHVYQPQHLADREKQIDAALAAIPSMSLGARASLAMLGLVKKVQANEDGFGELVEAGLDEVKKLDEFIAATKK